MVACEEDQVGFEGSPFMSALDESANAGVAEVPEAYRLDKASLTRWMEKHIESFRGPLSVSKFEGGQSNPTYRLEAPSRAYVLRRKPPGSVVAGAHAVDREARVQSALVSVGFPVARIFGFCDDAGVIGGRFYVMELVEGRIFWDATFPTVSRNERPAYFAAMNRTIGALHRIDPARVGLADYGKPGNYFARQISRWSRRYLDDPEAGCDANMDLLVAELPHRIPEDDESAIVHGDFRCDNMIFHPTERRILAVLDWQLSTLGHPLAYFAYHTMMYRMPPHIVAGLVGADLFAINIPSEAAYVAAYCDAAGRDGVVDWRFYVAFNFFRLAAIFHGIAGRAKRGSASSVHARERAKSFPQLTGLGVRAMQEAS
jgi:aminoglycoside phosphotransferase (APT) family kinase protein